MAHRETWERRLGQAIRKQRVGKGLTLQEAADAYGCTLRNWQFIEQGKSITLKSLFKVAKTLDVEAWKLLKGS